MRLINDCPPKPWWPKTGFRWVGKKAQPIDLADVPALPAEERDEVWFIDPRDPDGKTTVWPWKGSGYYVGSDGIPLVGIPLMREELQQLGMDDDQLNAEHAAYFEKPLRLGEPDDREMQDRRRRMYDQVAEKWHAEAPRRPK